MQSTSHLSAGQTTRFSASALHLYATGDVIRECHQITLAELNSHSRSLVGQGRYLVSRQPCFG